MTMAKLTPEVQEIIVTAIERNLPKNLAAGLAGIAKATFYRWMEQGEAGDQPYKDLRDAVIKAEAKGSKTLVNRIRKAGKKEGLWTANAWMLERTQRHEFGAQGDAEERINAKIEKLEKLIEALAISKGVITNGQET